MDAIISKLCPQAAFGSGATHGRRTYGASLVAAPGPFWVRKIKLTQGYDPGGAYWGDRPAGVSLYGYLSTNGTISGFLDAPDVKGAWAKLRERHPNAKRA
jgi:hypothetical protein